ncbi:MarR family winged helix-turn-helix transcriptional regulator [Mucilaginibacter gotjawali]|uniref:DNA-binding MarR family transcriptional regulator n=1 Tax=Mucilaginibacter gotjawali TaxID=1550579 RepID=A0A839SA75_9SPHI|nr:MarR family transcriptional regulator [Mucilaginibacter gotjawali]MBB3055051.1 DNA-binding MarR family transcriptional regulator [Mucilaginibacter gotjawali]
MNLYQSLGYLVMGSRLRRLSESFLSEINRAYQNEGIDFDASWFPVFYLLSKNDALSIKELSEQTEVSHPAASQLITNLKNKNLVTSATCADDGRRQLITLTDKGRDLLQQIMPVWDAILLAMDELITDNPTSDNLLPAVDAMEKVFKQNSLAEKIGSKLSVELKPAANE